MLVDIGGVTVAAYVHYTILILLPFKEEKEFFLCFIFISFYS